MSIEEVAVAIYRRVPMGTRPYLKKAWGRYSRVRRAVGRRSRKAQTKPTVATTSPTKSSAGHTADPGVALSSDTGLDPFVTVVVPAYNEQKWLGDCLASIAAQTLGDFECIVVDDASSDFTLDVAGEWAARDDRFRVVRHDRNRGLPASRNSGLALARGTFITFLDADDFVFPHSFERRAAALANTPDPTVIGVYCDWMPVEEQATLRDTVLRPAVDKPDIDFLSQRGENPFIATAPMLRTDVLRSLDGFNEQMASSEDFEAWMRVLRHGYRFCYLKDVGVAYRQRRSGMVLGSPAAHAEAALRVLNQLERPLAPADRYPGTPYVFDRPIGRYDDDLRRIRRLIPSLALAVASGDDAQVAAVGEQFPADSWYYVRNKLDARSIAQNALNRIVRADPTFKPARRDELATRSARLAEDFLSRPGGTPELKRPLAPEISELRMPGDGSIEVIEPRIIDISAEPELFGGVVMFPMARYHAEELVPLARELEQRGEQVSWVVTRHHPEDVRVEMRRHGVTTLFHPPSDWNDLPPFAAAVMLNDWGPTNDLIDVARSRGVPTFAKVEGVQDFDDVDTGRVRKPYRWADIVLCQGENDVRALEGATTHVVGSSRLEPIALGPEREFRGAPHVVVNSNFTYNVLTDERGRWLESVLQACGMAGVDVLVSQHQADDELPKGTPIAEAPMRRLLQGADVLISRFSTVPFEAMAHGVPFVYHNPHGEKVPTFAEPGDAYRIGTSTATLAAAITEALDWRGTYRERSSSFFARQISIDPNRSPAERAADVIVDAIAVS